VWFLFFLQLLSATFFILRKDMIKMYTSLHASCPLLLSDFKEIWYNFFFPCGSPTQRVSWPPHCWGFLDHTQRRTTVGRTPLDEWLARRRDLYLATHNTHNRQISMHPVGFEPMISAGERPQTYALDRAATGTGKYNTIPSLNVGNKSYSF
jgi:hypothetical protein